MTVARKYVVFEGVEAVYHCVSRCVRRSFICGRDPYNGKSYEHRKDWVRDRLEMLTGVFGIEVAAYAIMSNHLHIVIRTRPDWVEAWDGEETVRRWLKVFPRRLKQKGNMEEVRKRQIRLLADNIDRVAVLRRRLGSVSWFMRCLNENIARRANREEGLKGKFWESRYYCQALLDESAVLACMAYVDLNPVRAGVVGTPEESEFTSIFERIRSRGKGSQTWLCPVGEEGKPLRRGLLSLSQDEYLTLVDWTGREIRVDKSGAIPGHLEPLLLRIKVRPKHWTNTVQGFGRMFHLAAGEAESILKAARSAGKRWLAGITAGRKSFGTE
jgi:putative transposase